MDPVELLPLSARRNQSTSIDAARHCRRAGVQRRQIQIVHRLVTLRPGCTSFELSRLAGHKSDHLRHRVARRLPEAERLGLVTRGEVRACQITGRKAITWYPGIDLVTGEIRVLDKDHG